MKELNVPFTGEITSSGQYVVDIPDSESFAKVYSSLETNEHLDELLANGMVTEHIVTVSYLYEEEDTEVILSGDLDTDEYKLVLNIYQFGDDKEENENDEGEDLENEDKED